MQKMFKTHSSTIWQVSFCSYDLIFYCFTTVWTKFSQNSYLREFCAQVWQIVFLADLTILWLITTVWAKMSQNSYLRKFCVQVSQNVFLADFTVLRLNTTVWAKHATKFITPRVVCTKITNCVFSWFDRFTTYYYCMSKKLHKTHISTSSVHKYPKSCS